jgi:DNA invertase Pin-like site-specific DNA recombinase
LLVGPLGRPLAGNLDAWPSLKHSSAGFVEFEYERRVGGTLERHPARGRIFKLAGGFQLLIARDVHERYETERLFTTTLPWSVILTLTLGLIGGAAMSRNLIARLDRINSTTREIMAGDLARRLPVSPARDEFDSLAHNVNQMLDRIEAGEAAGILAWHPDRLARNSVDGGRIIYLLDIGKLRLLKFPRTWFENTPQGKLMLHNEFGFSKYYVDSLSENTKRGLREKVRRGESPQRAPLGYLNDYRTKKIIIDRERAPLVRKVFEQYATGEVTLDMLRSFFAEHKLRTKNGKLLGRSFVSNLLSNPMYYGHFQYSGEIYQGIHEPIISKALFDEAQAVLNSRWKWSPKLKVTPKAFLGLLRCSECGGAITAECRVKKQKNGNVHHYTYYRCTKKNRIQVWCSQPYILEADLGKEISALLAPFSLREDWAEAMLTRVKEEKKEHAQSSLTIAAQKRAEIEQINLRLQRLLDGFLDGVVERDVYTVEKAKLMSQKKTLQEQNSSRISVGHCCFREHNVVLLTGKRSQGKNLKVVEPLKSTEEIRHSIRLTVDPLLLQEV